MHNRLDEQTSPYLRQHADNPVHWQPWDDAALAAARERDQPILLSIGYSACHWCHVMAHESFEDEATAALMNAHFVNIKVDREERPDLDKIYQLCFQIMTQRPGGWPLTMMLDPKTHAPFMAGTYFPKDSGHGMPAFADVLRQVAQWYSEHSHELDEQKQQLNDVLTRLTPQPSASVGDASIIEAARNQLAANYDPAHGGFTGAPKFPHPGSLQLLYRLGARGDEEAARMADFSLARMCERGLFDQIGGGFYRYSVDERWEIPHFEKMLYDNGPLLALCAQRAGQPPFTASATACADWALHEMRSPDGAFFASLDADSDGGEGRYYLWTPDQIQAALQDDTEQAQARYQAATLRFGLDEPANFEGAWHLNTRRNVTQIAQALDQSTETVHQHLNTVTKQLRQARTQRPAPDRDEKILTAWNALMIQGLAVAARHLNRPDYADAACAAADFLHEHLWQNGRLLAAAKDGDAHLPAYLDDYAFLIDALLDLMQTRWRDADCRWAKQLADALLDHFEDKDNGGFYFTAHDHEQLLHRPKPLGDESTPAGNGIAARVLLRLGYLLGDKGYLDAGERTLRFARTALEKYPLAHTSLILALDDYLHPPEFVIIRAQKDALNEWREAATAANRLVFAIPNDATPPEALAEKAARDKPVAYLCRGLTCSPPIEDKQKLD